MLRVVSNPRLIIGTFEAGTSVRLFIIHVSELTFVICEFILTMYLNVIMPLGNAD